MDKIRKISSDIVAVVAVVVLAVLSCSFGMFTTVQAAPEPPASYTLTISVVNSAGTGGMSYDDSDEKWSYNVPLQDTYISVVAVGDSGTVGVGGKVVSVKNGSSTSNKSSTSLTLTSGKYTIYINSSVYSNIIATVKDTTATGDGTTINGNVFTLEMSSNKTLSLRIKNPKQDTWFSNINTI